MRKMRRVAVLLTAVALAMSLAAPAVAQGPKHKSCKEFGQFFAEFAHTGDAGQVISFNARNELTAPWGITYTPPGSIAAIVHDEMILLGLCEPA